MVEGDERTADECDGVHVKDYCKDCGCPKEICCRREGAITELKDVLTTLEAIDNMQGVFESVESLRLLIKIKEKRLKELQGELK